MQSLPGIGLLLASSTQAVARLVLNAFLPDEVRPSSAEQLTLRAGGRESRLPIWWRFGTEFVSADDLARALKVRTYLNEKKRKLVLYLPHNKVVLAAENPFVLIDGRVYQMPVPCLWHRDRLFVPIYYLSGILNEAANLRLSYDRERQILSLSTKQYNVTSIAVDSRENGTVIRIATSRKFAKGELTMDMRNGWLHVDLFGGKGDPAVLKRSPVRGLVRSIKVFQFEELLSLAFLLRREPLSRQVYQDPLTNDVVVVLTTREEPVAEQTSSEREGSDGQPGEEAEAVQQQLEAERRRWIIDTVVIDAGHGGKDPGAIGVGGLREKDVVLGVALKLGRLIEKNYPEIKVIYTRKDDTFIRLKDRTRIANEKNGKVFISIHANSVPNRRTSGFETYIVGPEKGEKARDVVLKENSVIRFEDPSSQKAYKGINLILATMAQSAFMRQSEHLASLVQQEMARRLAGLNVKSRGVKQGPFWVMVGATMPSILVEIGFVTNPHEARQLRRNDYQWKIAEGIFKGFQKFKSDYENAI